MAIVGLDLGRAPTMPMVNRLRETLYRKAGVSHVLFCASHTHHGPALEIDAQPDEAAYHYYKLLEQKLTDVVVDAASTAVYARVGWSSTDSKWNRNRRDEAVVKVRDPELLVA